MQVKQHIAEIHLNSNKFRLFSNSELKEKLNELDDTFPNDDLFIDLESYDDDEALEDKMIFDVYIIREETEEEKKVRLGRIKNANKIILKNRYETYQKLIKEIGDMSLEEFLNKE